MKPTTLPDGMPVLSRGRHRNPRRGACFMELASVLAGERWTDHPECTHPLLGQLARQVNDATSDAGRQELATLIPSVVGLRGDDRTWLTVAVAVAASAVLEAPERTQHVLAGGLMRAEQLCAELGPELDETRRVARSALDTVPGAVRWVKRLGLADDRIGLQAFARHSAPTMVRCAVEGVLATGRADTDRRLRGMLEAGIAAATTQPPAQPSSARTSAASASPS